MNWIVAERFCCCERKKKTILRAINVERVATLENIFEKYNQVLLY
jgi:hypothetical protein